MARIKWIVDILGIGHDRYDVVNLE
jgi:hypothetical protein